MSSQEATSETGDSNSTTSQANTNGNETKPTKTILVASLNPVKIAAALHGFQAMFPDVSFTARGSSIPSGVPEQPFSNQETHLGATNRASNARKTEPGPEIDFWVGIEGGVCEEDLSSEYFHPNDENPILSSGRKEKKPVALQSFAWVVVLGNRYAFTGARPTANSHEEDLGENNIIAGKARTATYYLPEETNRLVKGGMELGHAEDQVWGRSNSKQQNGSVGLLTRDVVDRKGYIQQAVVLALIPFKNPGMTF